MKGKVSLVVAIVVILIVSAVAVYYLEFGPGSNSPVGNPSLVYDFNSTIKYNSQDELYYGGSFLGWNASSNVFNNESDAVSIHFLGTLSRKFKALDSRVSVSFDWTLHMIMVVRRQLSGVFSDLNYQRAAGDSKAYTYQTTFDIDNGTMFTVEFNADTYVMGFLYRVSLWKSSELP